MKHASQHNNLSISLEWLVLPHCVSPALVCHQSGMQTGMLFLSSLAHSGAFCIIHASSLCASNVMCAMLSHVLESSASYICVLSTHALWLATQVIDSLLC